MIINKLIKMNELTWYCLSFNKSEKGIKTGNKIGLFLKLWVKNCVSVYEVGSIQHKYLRDLFIFG